MTDSVTGPTSNELAGLRTVMAADRTLMAWIRTSLSLLTFGFTIYKVLEGFVSEQKLGNAEAPRTVGLGLVIAGTLAMIMGTIDYWQMLKELHQTHRFSLARPQVLMAAFMAAGGLALCISIAAHAV